MDTLYWITKNTHKKYILLSSPSWDLNYVKPHPPNIYATALLIAWFCQF
jgi:hypothetical protein